MFALRKTKVSSGYFIVLNLTLQVEREESFLDGEIDVMQTTQNQHSRNFPLIFIIIQKVVLRNCTGL